MSSDDGFEMLSTMDCIYSIAGEETMTQTLFLPMYLPIMEVIVKLLLVVFIASTPSGPHIMNTR